VPVDRIARFDLNTSPTPPDVATRVLAAGRFETPMSEYPPSDYRRLSAAAAARYGVAAEELLVGAGADEILDIVAKAWLPPGGTAVIPTPSYSMYRVLTEQRGAAVRSVPRLKASAGYAIDVPATREAAHGADLVWLCSPNNPTGLAEPPGGIAQLLDGLLADAAGSRPPGVLLDEAYAEFAGESLLALRDAYPRLVVVRTLSKAYALAARVAAELTAAGWSNGPSVTNFLLADFGSAARAEAVAEALLRRGLVPRTFGPAHPLADHLRLTIRATDQNDRLIAAARELAAERDR
jgi:histidinol-phosphate aminotransferase